MSRIYSAAVNRYVLRLTYNRFRLPFPPTQALELGSARSSSYPFAALPRALSRLPRVDANDDISIEDAVEAVASAMCSSMEE